VELCEPEAVGLLDDHDRRVRDVDADFDHRRRDENVQLPRLEPGHQVTTLVRPQTAVEEPHAVVAQLTFAEPLGLTLGGPSNTRLRFLDQRADDIRLPPAVEMLAQPLVGGARALLSHPGGLDRLPVRRRLRDLGHGEVAVDGQRKRSGDRRGGHVQDVRAPAGGEGRTLLDPETVLLVHDRDSEVAEVDALLDQRMGPDDDLRRPDVVLDGAGQ
jgi:hypothetical protein